MIPPFKYIAALQKKPMKILSAIKQQDWHISFEVSTAQCGFDAETDILIHFSAIRYQISTEKSVALIFRV